MGDMKKTGRHHKISRKDYHQELSCHPLLVMVVNHLPICWEEIQVFSRRLNKDFIFKFYKSAAKPRLTSAMKIKILSLASNIFTGLGKNEGSFIFWRIHSKAVRKPNNKDLMRSTPSVQSSKTDILGSYITKRGIAGLYLLSTSTTMNGL